MPPSLALPATTSPAIIRLAGATVLISAHTARLELDRDVTDDTYDEALRLLPPEAELVATGYAGDLDVWTFAW